MRHIPLAVVLACTACTAPKELPPHSTLTITDVSYARLVTNDPGGDVDERAYEIRRLPQQEVVMIVGYCASACTMYLGHPNVCATSDSIFRFHGPSRKDGQPLKRRNFESASRVMARFYPTRLRNWFMETGRMVIGQRYFEVTGADLIVRGFVRECV